MGSAPACLALSASFFALHSALRCRFSCFSSSVFSSFFFFHALHGSTPQFHFIHLRQALRCILISSRFISGLVFISCDCGYGCSSDGGGGPWNGLTMGAAWACTDENPPPN